MPGVRDCKVMQGTRDFLQEPAMTEEEALQALSVGIDLVRECKDKGYQLIGTGEMGIGNTTTSSMLVAVSTENPDQVTEIYNSVSDYLVTSVDFTSMIEQLMNYSFSEDQMYTVPGKTVEGKPIDGKRYEEYHVDEDAMEELIMKVFYTPVQ